MTLRIDALRIAEIAADRDGLGIVGRIAGFDLEVADRNGIGDLQPDVAIDRRHR